MIEAPIPPKPDLENSDAEQRRLASKVAPRNPTFSRAYAVIKESVGVILSPVQKRDLADALADLGRFNEAADLGTDQSEFYRSVWEAVWADDEDRCECQENTVSAKVAKDAADPDSPVAPTDFLLKHRFVLREIFSLKHGNIFPLVKCNRCGYVNVYDF